MPSAHLRRRELLVINSDRLFPFAAHTTMSNLARFAISAPRGPGIRAGLTEVHSLLLPCLARVAW